MAKNIIIEGFKQYGIMQFGEFVLKSGQKSDVYFDMRSIISYPNLMADICLELSKLIGDSDVVVTGVPMSGIPFAIGVAGIMNIPAIMIRETRKDHGLEKLVEGNHFGREIVLIDDVCSTGISIINIVKIIESEGLVVRKIVTILNRGNGIETVRNLGYNIEALFTMDEIMKYTKADKALVIRNKTVKTLIDIVNKKKSNLVVSLDLNSALEILKNLELIGDCICAVKIHFDVVDFAAFSKADFVHLLRKIAREKSFMIIFDRKFSDIAATNLKQYELIKGCCDMVTLHGICGESVVAEFAKMGVPVLLIHQLSTSENLIDNVYSHKIRNIGLKYDNVVGFIGQKVVANGYLTFTPGINGLKSADGMGQQYKSVGDAQGDIFIVGRGIYESENIAETAQRYRELCFKKWKYDS